MVTGDASVDLNGRFTVYAYDNAEVEAHGGCVGITAHDSVKVMVSGCKHSSIDAFDNAEVEAHDSTRVYAHDFSEIDAYDTCDVMMYNSATLNTRGDGAVVRYTQSSKNPHAKGVSHTPKV